MYSAMAQRQGLMLVLGPIAMNSLGPQYHSIHLHQSLLCLCIVPVSSQGKQSISLQKVLLCVMPPSQICFHDDKDPWSGQRHEEQQHILTRILQSHSPWCVWR